MDNSETPRPSWDEYFIGLVDAVSTRATCDRGKSGCVIVKNKRIISTGYVGSPPGMAHCDKEGHLFQKALEEDGTVKNHCVRTTHAEQNAICQAAKAGVSIDGGTIYCTMTPCFVCAKLLVTCGIVRVVAKRDYHASALSKDLFQKAGVKLEILDPETVKYEKQ